jgi:hypothetical protein
MMVQLEVQFKTARPIGQAAGMEMWGLGDYFVSTGPCAYMLQSKGEAESLTDALEGLIAQISEVIGSPGGWDVVVTKTKAEMMQND